MAIKQQKVTIKLEKEKNLLPSPTFVYLSKDIMDTTGIARVEFPYNTILADKLKTGAKDIIITGGTINTGSGTRIFYGEVNETKRVGDTLSVSLNDYGKNFKALCQTTYTDEKVEDVLKKLIKECEFEPKLQNISPEILSKKISQSTTMETPTAGGEVNPISTVSNGISNILGGLVTNATAVATGAINTATGNCVSFTGKPSCSYKCGPYQSVTKSWINKCPNCNKTGTMINKQKKDAPEGQMTCSSCDCDFCINCGREKWVPPHCPGLTPCSGGTPAGGGTTGSSESYEDVLNKICTENNLYMYLDHYKKCYIQEFRGVTKAQYDIGIDMIQRSYYSYMDGEAGDKDFEIRVKYKNGTVSKFFGGKEKVKEENVQKYDKPDLDQSKADEFAQKTLLQTLRERNIELAVRCMASPSIYPGVWLRLPKISDFSKKEIMYVCGLATVIRPRKPIHYDIVLKYAPPMPPQKNVAGTAGPANLATLDAIGQKAATFVYNHSCSQAACLESGGQGDCYAMSEWLYNNITALGTRAQILWCSGPNNHRTVQIDAGSGWQDFDYRKYNIAQNFRVSSNRSGCRVYR